MEPITNVFQVTQQLFSEGNFGDLENGGERLIGVYSSCYLAEKAVSMIPVSEFHAQFGSAKQDCLITEVELDKVPEQQPVYLCKRCACIMDNQQYYCSYSCERDDNAN